MSLWSKCENESISLANKALFTENVKSFNTLDLEKQEYCILPGLRGSITQSRDEFDKMSHKDDEY